MKEILITKERNNEKFQEFRRMILENLAVVLKIICGDKFLIHKFDTKDYMDYEPKFVTKEEYAMNMVERDLHEVYNIMTQGYTEVCNGGSIEKRYLTDKYNVSTLVSTETKTKNNTQEIKMKEGKEKMAKNVRILEESVEKGLLQGYALESAKQTLEKIDHRTTGVDTWVLENNEGTYGTEIVITKDGHIDLYLCIMEKYSSRVSYIRVGNFQPEFGQGDIWLPNGEIKEYQKLGTIINALNKEYEKYGFYFTADTKNNRRILADARKSYELFEVEEKERKRKENLVKDLASLSGSTLAGLLKELGHEGEVTYTDIEELERELVKFFEKSDKKYDCWQDVFADYKENYLEVERLKKNLVKKEQELLSKEVTFDIDGEGKVEEIKDASYADANENYKRRKYQAPEKGNGYDKTYVTMKLDGKKFHDMVICLHGETEHHNLKDAILAQLKVLRKTWVEGDGVPYFKPEKNKEIIEKKYGSKEKLAIVLDAKEMVVRSLGLDNPEPAPKAQLIIGFERTVIRTFNSGDKVITPSGEIANVLHFATPEQMYLVNVEGKVDCELYKEEDLKKVEEVTIETHTEKMEEKEMNTINKNALTNRMTKLGEFLKENRDKDAVEKRIKELFPMAMEIDVFEECDNSVFFLVGQEYVGKKPTKKEIEEDDIEVKYVVDTYGLTVNVDILDDSIEISSSIGVDYIDKYNNHYNTSCTVKEIKIETPKEEVISMDDIVYMEVLEKNIDELIEEYNAISAEIEVINLNKSIGLDLDVDTTEKEKELECILSRILELGSVVRLTYSHRCFMNVPDVDVLFKNMGDAEKFERENENILEVIDIIKMEDMTKITDLEEHMLSILELMDDKEGVGYMYRSTFAVKKEDKYELTSVLEDMWTGLTVYIGNYANVINSKSIEVTDIIEELIKTEKTNELVEKIKGRFENKSNGQKVYVLMYCNNILEVYNNYDDAYSHMVEDANRLCKEFNSIYDVEIDKYGATMETMSWKIIKKIVK